LGFKFSNNFKNLKAFFFLIEVYFYPPDFPLSNFYEVLIEIV
jgi:hypothetical protein